LEENPDNRVFLLSQMIHNQEVNADLEARGIQFIMDTQGNQFVPWSALNSDDVVIVPAFGTTLEIEKILEDIGIGVQRYNTTCPFVEKVWKRSDQLGTSNHTIVIHGKPNHEETRATFSHSKRSGPAVIVRDLEDARLLGEIILGTRERDEFYELFRDKYSPGFDALTDLEKVGVINQTTMLASETQTLADHLKRVMIEKYGLERLNEHFADTRDTLCYATNDNQEATLKLLEQKADLAVVVGGYNSSNTSHLVELCKSRFRTFFINSEKEIMSSEKIWHYDLDTHSRQLSQDFLPTNKPLGIILTSGASCPDAIMERVLLKILGLIPDATSIDDVMNSLMYPD